MNRAPADADPIMALSPREVAADMIALFRDKIELDEASVPRTERDQNGRYAVHRAAEVRAWELHKAHGGHETAKGRQFAKAAGEIADYYHDVAWRDEHSGHHVPLLGVGNG
jgi:hypothetical protein